MRDGSSQLQAAVRQLSRTHVDLRLHWGAQGDAFRSLATVADPGSETLAQWLSATTNVAAGLDQKTRASYLLSNFSWQLGLVLGGLYLSRLPLPLLGPEAIAAKHRLSGTAGAQTLEFDLGVQIGGSGVALDRDTMSASIVALATPILDGLYSRTRLARRAMWRLVTDGISAGFLSFGKLTGDVDTAIAEAEAILRRPELPLHNDRWRFVTVDCGGIREPFRLRGGCCRIYRGPHEEFCTTCVLRDESQQIERLQAYLLGRAAG